MSKKILIIILVTILCIQNSYAAKKIPPPVPEEAAPTPDTPENVTSSCKDIENCVVVFPSLKYQEQYLITSQMAPTLIDLVSILKTTEPAFLIEFRECGEVNSWYSQDSKKITLCYDYMANGDIFIEKRYANQPPEVQANLQMGIFLQVLMHEFGHAAIDIEHIPVLGNEEDAADRIATITMLEFANNNPNMAKLAIVGTAAYWNAQTTGLLEKMLAGNSLYADEHPLSEQRMFNIVCLAYGSNPSLYLDVVRDVGLPQVRAERCEDEYRKAKSAVNELLK